MIVAAVIMDVELAGASAETTVVSGSSSYYSSVAAWEITAAAVDATTAATTAVSGSSSYYSSAAVWDAATAVDAVADAIVDASSLVHAGKIISPHLSCYAS